MVEIKNIYFRKYLSQQAGNKTKKLRGAILMRIKFFTKFFASNRLPIIPLFCF
jgi:hypothetical protein